jgi:organic hydroperoxide reductase OsmC/OhrA
MTCRVRPQECSAEASFFAVRVPAAAVLARFLSILHGEAGASLAPSDLMTPFPHEYRVSLANRQLLAPPRSPIAAGPPPQFGGSDRSWSPEELLAGAVLECLWTTFEAFARRDGLQVEEWFGSVLAILDRGRPVPVFTEIRLSVAMRVMPGEEARAGAVLEKAEQACIISHALKIPVTLDSTIAAIPAPSARSAGT